MKPSSYNLVMSAMFNGRKGERPPAVNPTSIACHELMDATGISFPEAHVNANAMAELALAGHEIVGFDSVMPEYSVVQEAAALGADVDWGGRDRMPDTKSFLYEDFSDITIPDDFLERPPIRVVLDALSILRLILHVCGNCTDRLELFSQAGFDAYHFEWQVDAKRAVETVGDRMSLVGNVNNPQALLQGTPEDVHKQVRYAIAAGVQMIGPECAIPLPTPVKNLKAIVAAVHEGY